VLCASVLIVNVDNTILNVALPTLVRDLQATLLNQFGIKHEKFTYKYQGLDQKLTGVEKASVVDDILA